jgi:predicted DNA-binding transcriptional regulator AlpA
MEEVISDKELSQRLKLSRVTLWKYRKTGQLPHFKVGKKVLYELSQIERFMALFVRGGGERAEASHGK